MIDDNVPMPKPVHMVRNIEAAKVKPEHKPKFKQGKRGNVFRHRPHGIVKEHEPLMLFERRLNASPEVKRARNHARAVGIPSSKD